MSNNIMEISEVVNTQLVFPGLVVGLVLVCAVLVFVFGFKSVEDFPFDKLATVADDRKPAGKKRKVKDKKSQSNGQATVVSETKQKTSESASSKVAPSKSKQVDKSPAKDAPKATNKQEKKQGKTETPPVKAALKDTKNIKETNKISEESQKQGKAKDTSGKQQKDQSNKQAKSKGKENVEVQNKKNKDKSKKLEEKPDDYDNGDWVTVSKKAPKSQTIDEEKATSKSTVKNEATSPGKKKKTKPESEAAVEKASDVTLTPAPTAPTQASIPEAVKENKEKPVKKEKEQKKEKAKPAEESPVVAVVESNATESENEGKAAKKKKKKPSAKENAEPQNVSEEKKTVEEVVPEPSKPAESKPAEVPQPAFDELGDTWKEAKTQKKSAKKKVRKAE